MKLARIGQTGMERPALIDDAGRLRDLGGVIHDISPSTLSRESLSMLRSIDPTDLPLIEGKVRYGPPVAGTSKFLAIGLTIVTTPPSPETRFRASLYCSQRQ